MADTTVSIDKDGVLSPPKIHIHPGDRVTFVTTADTVLCMSPASVFGSERFEIPAGQRKQLIVQPTGGAELDFIARTGDLHAECRGPVRDRTSRGGGTVSGGPD